MRTKDDHYKGKTFNTSNKFTNAKYCDFLTYISKYFGYHRNWLYPLNLSVILKESLGKISISNKNESLKKIPMSSECMSR